MNVLIVNGSPHEDGCTATALGIVAGEIERAGVRTRTVWVGTKAVHGCVGCGRCSGNGHRCVFSDDPVNHVIDCMGEADGLVIGAPTHYANPAGSMVCLLDRLFYAGDASIFAHKPAAVVATARRAGTTSTLDVLAKYPTIAQMPLVSSEYWPMAYGTTPDEVLRDKEGIQVMRTLGRDMAWMLRCIEAGRAAGVEPPEPIVPREWTNFIR